LFETYQELMCHFYICLDVHNARWIVNGMGAYYLFSILDNAPEKV